MVTGGAMLFGLRCFGGGLEGSLGALRSHTIQASFGCV